MSLLQSDGIVAFYLLNDCAQALARGPVDTYSEHCLLALDALLAAAVKAGIEEGACAELKTWMRLQPDLPRTLVLAVVIGAAIPDEEVGRITDIHIEPYLPGEKAAA